MTVEERESVHHMIIETIEKLHKSSVGANHMGSRYARLLQLLWRKAPKRSDPKESQDQESMANRITVPQDHCQSEPQSNLNLPNSSGMRGTNNLNLTPPGTFSWLDLGATWDFAARNNFDDIIADVGLDAYDISFMADFSLLDGDNPKLIF
jgi:hypothetical protein